MTQKQKIQKKRNKSFQERLLSELQSLVGVNARLIPQDKQTDKDNTVYLPTIGVVVHYTLDD